MPRGWREKREEGEIGEQLEGEGERGRARKEYWDGLGGGRCEVKKGNMKVMKRPRTTHRKFVWLEPPLSTVKYTKHNNGYSTNLVSENWEMGANTG